MNAFRSRRIVADHKRSLEQVTGRSFQQSTVEFLVINLDRDLERGIFLTARLAYESRIPEVRAIYEECRLFFRKLDQLMSAGTPESLAKARGMLSFPEPWELRLGYAQKSSYGTGMDEGPLGDHLFAFLLARPDHRKRLADEPDALCLVPWVDMDRTSDIIGTIGKRHLITFTQRQANFWQFDPECMADRRIDHCWNGETERYEPITARLPGDDLGRAFLLVWREMCRSGPAMNAAQYFRDLDPTVGGAGFEVSKSGMWQHATTNPKVLDRFVAARMKDPSRFQPRRDLRPPKDSRRSGW